MENSKQKQTMHPSAGDAKYIAQQLHNFMQQMRTEMNALKEELRAKQFYTIPEFSEKTGLKESTIKGYCLNGKLKASQTGIGCKWLVYASELDRLRKEARENHYSDRSIDHKLLKL